MSNQSATQNPKNTKSAEIYPNEIILRDELLQEVVSMYRTFSLHLANSLVLFFRRNRSNTQVTKKVWSGGEAPLMVCILRSLSSYHLSSLR